VACSSSGADKAGGTRAKPPVVLTLADHEQSPAQVQFWIEEVQRRAGGSLRIQATNRWREQEVAYDQATIADVQAGRVQLAKINARAYDTVGVDSFQPLVAPLLIDNPTLERRVLESDLAGQMLAGTGELGLVGLALLPTDLRKPLGVTRPLVKAKDYRGARMGVREGEVAKATVTALGATPVPTVPGGPLRGLDGLDIDLGGIRGSGYDPDRQRHPLALAGDGGDQPHGVRVADPTPAGRAAAGGSGRGLAPAGLPAEPRRGGPGGPVPAGPSVPACQ
jgi:hypothetical protein